MNAGRIALAVGLLWLASRGRRVASLDLRHADPDAGDGETTAELKAGTLLFHGTSAAADFDLPEAPAWFSSSETVARTFVWWRSGPDPRVMVYRLVVAQEVLVWRDRDDVAAFLGDTGAISTRELARIVRRRGYDGWLYSDAYGEGRDDVLLWRPGALDLVDVIETPTPQPIWNAHDSIDWRR